MQATRSAGYLRCIVANQIHLSILVVVTDKVQGGIGSTAPQVTRTTATNVELLRTLDLLATLRAQQCDFVVGVVSFMTDKIVEAVSIIVAFLEHGSTVSTPGGGRSRENQNNGVSSCIVRTNHSNLSKVYNTESLTLSNGQHEHFER